MTYQEAEKIFKEYQDYMEIHSKMNLLFASLPESFLPYSADVINEALNIIAESFNNKGDNNAINKIRETQKFLFIYDVDEKALISMTRKLNIIQEDKRFKELFLKRLKENKEDWLKFKMNKLYDNKSI